MKKGQYKKKMAFIASSAQSILNFRRELVVDLSRYFHVKVFAPYENEEVQQKIIALGVECHPIPMNNQSINPLSDLKLVKYLIAQFKLFKPYSVFSYTIKPVIWGSIAAKIVRIENIYSMITGLGYAFTEVSTLKHKLVNLLVRYLYKNALSNNRVIFFQNPDDLQLFQQLKLVSLQKRVVLLNGSGVDIEYFSCCIPVQSPIRFLMIARLLKDKGIYEYWEVARRIKQHYPSVEFHLVGYLDDNPHSLMENELRKLQNSEVIIFHGRLSDVREVIQQCSVYVLPSYREGLPRSVLEAMAMGRPIITTDAPGCRETVIEGVNGFLVPIKNVEKLVEAVEKFIRQPGLIATMGKESRKIAEEKFDVRKVNQDILKHLGLLEEG